MTTTIPEEMCPSYLCQKLSELGVKNEKPKRKVACLFTISQVIDWLREEKKIIVDTKHLYKGDPNLGVLEYSFSVHKYHPYPGVIYEDTENYPRRNDALLKGIEWSFNNLIESDMS